VSAARAWAGIAIILLMGAFALLTFASYAEVLLRGRDNSTGIEMDANRFRGLREVLPARGVVGYLSDTTEGMAGTRAYCLTQYYLAPLVVAQDPSHDLVIGNFASPAGVARTATAHDLTVARDFGNGVTLLRRVSR
jgi:hypothetical protein